MSDVGMTGTMKAAPLPPTVRTAMIMGLPFSLHLRGESGSGRWEPGNPDVDEDVEAVWAELRWADRVFSTYLPDSEISRIRRRELRVRDADPAVAEVLHFAEIARRLTEGTFDVRATGALDPSGIVKGWAAARAARALDGLGLDYYLNAGGDVLLRSKRPDTPWRIGIEHPDDPSGLLAVVELPVGGVATSGQAHRGSHICNPATGRPARGVTQATVVGPSLVWADVLATAVVAGELENLNRSGWPPGHEVLLVTDEGAVLASPGFRSFLAPDVPAPPIVEIS
jgi:thiamine biosynthesis lipoprotein